MSETTWVIVLDANLPVFTYGEKALSAKRVQANWFSDYGYDPVRLNLQEGLYPPIVSKRARPAILDCATQLHTAFHRERNPARLSTTFQRITTRLDRLLSFTEIESQIISLARRRRVNVKDICVVWLPFDFVFRIPLTFLGHSLGRPLVQTFGGVSCALSLVAIKYSIMKHHWMSGRHLNRNPPRCVLFSADPTGTLDLDEEIRRVAKHFPRADFATFRHASTADFNRFSSAGEILWFCGHGTAKRHPAGLGDQFEFLQSGPQFADRMITNYELISSLQHNFESVWLMVMNCCMLGESEVIGSNPIGFITATYAAGAVACVSSVWAVGDDAAFDLADELAAAIQANYAGTDFPRARAVLHRSASRRHLALRKLRLVGITVAMRED